MTSAPESDGRPARRLRLAEAEFGDYDVFISHRGPDTKSVFVGCLDGALKRAGFQPFLDCKSIDVGQYSWDCIEHAIQRTPLAVVVFSKGFAESEWCLRELHALLACLSVKVIPVFYDVEPWEVKYPEKGRLAAGFSKLEKRHDGTLIKEWRADLKAASTIRGEVCGVGSKRLVEDVVAEVVEKICELANKPLPLHVGDHVFGHKEVAGNLIRTIDEKKVSVLGLWGMGGIGKSTLAREIFNQLKGSFDASCYVENVTKMVDDNGVLRVQNDILKALCGDQSVKDVLSESQGKVILEERLPKKRILVVLDDVSDDDQMGHLMSLKMLKEGSLCIVTSRNRRVYENSTSFLVNAKVHTHEVQALSDEDSQAVLACHVFGRDVEVPQDFRVHVGVVSKACGGVPLVLEVIGSQLKGEKDVRIWKEVLGNLDGGTIMDEGKVLEALRRSYDSLWKSHQELFLDVACVSLGTSAEKATIAGRSQRCALRTLVERALIRVDVFGKLRMHDLLRDMGRQISKEHPSMGKRLWGSESLALLKSKKARAGTVETMDVQGSGGDEVDLSSMEGLRILKWRGDFVAFSSLPGNLRWLEFHETSIEGLPGSFGNMRMLEVLDLSDCFHGEELPNSFGGLENLKYLALKRAQIRRLPLSFGDLRKLEVLYLYGCRGLTGLPASFGRLQNLKRLNLRESGIKSLPESFGWLENLNNLDLSDTNIGSVPESFKALRNLESLGLMRCEKFVMVPDLFRSLLNLKSLVLGGSNIRSLPESVWTLSNLNTLMLFDCDQLVELSDCFGGLQKLKYLRLDETKIRRLPESIGSLSNLKELDVSNCNQLVELPDFFGGLQCLETLRLCRTKIRSLPESIGTLSNLVELKVSRCGNLVELPDFFGGLQKLRYLYLTYSRIRSLPDSIGKLSNLKELDLGCCIQLVELPNSVGNLPPKIEVKVRSQVQKNLSRVSTYQSLKDG